MANNRSSPPPRRCHESLTHTNAKLAPNHTKQFHRIRRMKGQLEGVERMIEKRRYCPDIISQVQAIRSALSSLAAKLLEEHLHSCVKEAFQSGNEREKSKKIEEVLDLMRRS